MRGRGGRWPLLALAVAGIGVGVLAGLLLGAPGVGARLPAAKPAQDAAQPQQIAAPQSVWQKPETLVLQVYFRNMLERDRLATELGAEEMATTGGYLTVFGDNVMYHDLISRGLRVEIDEKATRLINDPSFFGDTFYNGYKTVEETQAYMAQLAATYPTLATVVDYGDSWCKAHPGTCTQPNAYNGYDLQALHITNTTIPGSKPVFWFDTGIHSREIATPEVAMRMMSWLLDGYANNADAHWLVDYHDIWIIPNLNPDGHHIVEAGGGGNSPYYQRKNSNNTNGCTTWPPSVSNQFGTDNNRNFPFLWNCCGGSSGSPCDQTYHGTGGNSDPETQGVVNRVRLLIPDQRGPNNTDPAPLTTTGILQSMHSNASLNLYPWGWTTTAAPNGPDMANAGQHLSALNAGGNGYQSCQPPNCLYAVDGDSTDWSYGELGIASYTTEVGGSDFLVPLSYVDNTIWPGNRGALVYEAKIARYPYLLAHGPDANVVTTNPMTTTSGTPVQLTSTINFAWTGNAFSQNVGAAEYYVDTPPWAGGTAVAMQPTDGNFNSPTEGAQATIDTTGWSVGLHIVFVRGRGVNMYQGNQTWGPISAAFISITGVGPSPTPTITPGGPTFTPTRTATITPTASPTACTGSNYVLATGTATIVAGTTDTGNHDDDAVTNIPLPFAFTFYGQSFASANVSSNGNLQFNTQNTEYANACLPYAMFNYAMIPHWDDLCTGPCGSTNCTNCGIFTSTSGTAPTRIFNIEWRANYFSNGAALNFEIRLYEGQNRIDFVYGAGVSGASTTVGLQKDNGSVFTQYLCNGGSLTNGLLLSYTLPPCGTATATPPPQNTPTGTATVLALPTVTLPPLPTVTLPSLPTQTPGGPSPTVPPPTATPPQATATPCTLDFTDVPANDPFYAFIRCLVCRGIVSGYSSSPPCTTGTPCFLPNNTITRGQISKMISLAANLQQPIPSTQQTFEDTPPSNPFWLWIERLAQIGSISGYNCGGPGEPCNPPGNRPYFRPYAVITRGQIAKVDTLTEGYTDVIPSTQQTFTDVPGSNPFWLFVERANLHGVIAGYSDAGHCGASTPCFLPYNSATRGQSSKIVANTFFPNCDTPQR